MKKFFLLLPLSFLLLASCNKDEQTGGLDLTFKATYDGQPLVMLDEYDYEGGLKLTFQRFNFYISDLELFTSSEPNVAQHTMDIDFVDFDNHASTEEAENGVKILWDDLDVGDYAGIRIGLGVPADLNATADSDYSGSHPLARASHYWPGWESFIFTMMNAKVDTDGDGMFDDSSVLYHTGSDECYRMKEVMIPIRIEEDQVADLTFTIDIQELFRDGSGYIDILTNTNTHDISNLSVANLVMDNFVNALKVAN